MKRFFLLLYSFWLLHLNRKIMLAMLLVIPLVIFPLSIVLFNNNSTSQPTLGVYSTEDDSAVRFILSALQNGEKYAIKPFSPARGRKKASTGDIQVMLVFPDDTKGLVLASSPKPVKMISIYPEEILESLVNDINRYAEIYRELYTIALRSDEAADTYLNEYLNSSYAIKQKKISTDAALYSAAAQGIGMLLVLLMIQILYTCSLQFPPDKLHTHKVNSLLPSGNLLTICANGLSSLILAAIQTTLALLCAHLLFHIHFGISLLLLVLHLVLYIGSTYTISFLFMKLCWKRMRFYECALLFTLPAALLSGCIIPVAGFPSPVRIVSAFFPQYRVLDAIKSAQSGLPATSMLPGIGILISYALLAAILSKLLAAHKK